VEDAATDEALEAHEANDDTDAEMLVMRKTKGDGYVEQDN
jgi:hypothetical protein